MSLSLMVLKNFIQRKKEADEYYDEILPGNISQDLKYTTPGIGRHSLE